MVSIVVAGFVLWTPRASADTWTETSEADFLGGTLTDVQVAPSGDVTLAGFGGSGLTKQGVVVDHGSVGSFDDVRAFNPFVLRESATTWKMWYTAYDGSRFRMAFADSTDGLTWTKRGVVINVLTPPWNFDSVSGMSVIKEGATYHVWFSAGYWTGSPCPAGYWSQVYYATSSDGISWSISGSVLGLGAPGAWDECALAAPSVVYDGSLYRMYYPGWDGSVQHVGLATSPTKTGFTRYPGNPIVSPGPAGTWEDWYIAADAVTTGTPWTMYYVAHDGTNARLGLATSTDGYAWTKDPGNPVLDIGPAAWDSVSITSAVLVADPGGNRLYYAGYDGTYIRTGYASFGVPFAPSGTYTSRVFDPGGLGTTWQTISWSETTPPGTTVSLFVRAGSVPTPGPSWTPWTQITGPSSGTPLSVARSEFIQYRADLATADTSVTPALHDVTITYQPNGAPSATATFPTGGVWLTTQTPMFQWSVSDPEGDPQAGFEVQLSTDPGFANYLSSGPRGTSVPSWQAPVLAEGVWNWRVRIADPFGVWGAWSSASFGIDVTAPETTATLAGTQGSAGWYVGSVTVTLALSDATSGVASATYRTDGGAWQTYASSFLVAGDGSHQVEFYATDVAGNVEALAVTQIRIDTTAPTTTAMLLGQRPADIYTSHVVVELTGDDVTSGVALTEVRVDGGAWQPYTGAFRVTGDGAHTVEFRSTDLAGNEEGVKSVSFQIDTNLLGPSGPVGPWLLVLLIAVVAGFVILGFLLLRKRQKPEEEAPSAGAAPPPPEAKQ